MLPFKKVAFILLAMTAAILIVRSERKLLAPFSMRKSMDSVFNTTRRLSVISDLRAEQQKAEQGWYFVSSAFLVVVATYDNDINWLLENDTATGERRPILPVELYQIANIDDEQCQPSFPRLPSKLTSKTITAVPRWPLWAQTYIDQKCAMKAEAEPLSAFDVERRARLEAGLPWGDDDAESTKMAAGGGGRGTRTLLLEAQEESEKNSDDDDDDVSIATAPPQNSSDVVIIPSLSPTLPLHIIPAMGRESMAYLSAIINNYENLPDMVLFLHGHEMAWHTFAFGQRWVLQRLRFLTDAGAPRNLTKGFMQLSCIEREESYLFPRVVDANHNSMNGPRWKESMAGYFLQSWAEHLGEAFGEKLPPKYIKAACCATFAASREALQRRPLSFYVGIRNWLMTTNQDKYWPGISLEFSWHMMFTGEAVYDPPIDQCRRELYDM